MQKSLIILFALFFTFCSYGQSDSPYEYNWARDATWVGVGLGLNVVGVLLIQEKPDLTDAELQALSKDDVIAIDRWAAGNYSPEASHLSDFPFYGSFAVAPLMMLINKEQREDFGKLSILFIETMATTGALFTITAGAIERSRPLVYNPNVPYGERVDGDSQRSFFAGHTAATAAATFFTAKVFNDYYPDSQLKPFIWIAAAAIPAWVGYLRLKAGKHFLTDNIIGYGIGALSGILIPEIHKKENKNLTFFPSFGKNYKGLGLVYHF